MITAIFYYLKNFMLLLILLIINIHLFGQNTFELCIKQPSTDDQVFDAIECEDGYIFVGNRGQFSPQRRSLLIKTNKKGDILKYLEYPLSDSTSTFLNLFKISDTGYIVISGISEDPVQGTATIFRINWMDSAFKVLSYKQYEIPKGSYMSDTRTLLDGNKLFVYGCLYYGTNEMLQYPYIYEFDLNGNLVNHTVINYKNAWTFEMVKGVKQGEHLLFTLGYNIYSAGQIIVFDSLLQIKSVNPIPNDIHNLNNAAWLSPNKLLVTGQLYMSDPPSGDFDIAEQLLDSAFNYINIVHQGNIGSDDYAGFRRNLGFLDVNKIFIGGTANFDGNMFSSVHSPFMLSNIDSSLNLHWLKYYSYDANYHMWGMLATQDGGCLMYGTRYDSFTQNEERDVYILKVNEDGIYTGIDDIPTVRINNALVYPNPARETLNVQTQLKEAVISMYDMNGKEILTQELHQGISNIAIHHLAAGLYFYRITSHGKFIESGKWLKE